MSLKVDWEAEYAVIRKRRSVDDFGRLIQLLDKDLNYKIAGREEERMGEDGNLALSGEEEENKLAREYREVVVVAEPDSAALAKDAEHANVDLPKGALTTDTNAERQQASREVSDLGDKAEAKQAAKDARSRR